MGSWSQVTAALQGMRRCVVFLVLGEDLATGGEARAVPETAAVQTGLTGLARPALHHLHRLLELVEVHHKLPLILHVQRFSEQIRSYHNTLLYSQQMS